MTEPRFRVGDRVVAVRFVDCFGAESPQSPPMTVTDVRHVEITGRRCPSYYRVTAREGFAMREGAERFFRLAE